MAFKNKNVFSKNKFGRKDKFSYGRLSDEDFIFEEEDKVAIEKEKRPSIGSRFYGFVSSRYAFIAIIALVFGALIFYETASLQFNPTTAIGIQESTGVPRQQTVKAARGDILDAAGVPLAWSEAKNKLFITYTGLDNQELNERLLDLYLFLESYDIEINSNLKTYLDLDYEPGQTYLDLNSEGRPRWQESLAEVLYWQKSRNLFNLRDIENREQVRFDDSFVKINPDMFYNYLLYEVFNIEDPAADGQKYSQGEAFRIMQLRYMIYENNWAFINGTPIELVRDVPDGVIHIINEQNYRFMGIISSRESERVYSDLAREISHVIGYIGPIDSSEYNRLQHVGYTPDAMIGKSGVELSAERYLAGQDGSKPYNVWTVAQEAGMFYSEGIGKDPIPGNHVRLTIDMELQQVAVDSLNRVIEEIRNDTSVDTNVYRDADAGSVVMLDVKTGAVLAMASSPGYDPADFIKSAYDKEATARIQEYLTDSLNTPMMNRAITGAYAPGSTFKPLTAVAGLENGVISPNSNVYTCEGTLEMGELTWRCLSRPRTGHGPLNLQSGMATSCNLYFYHLGEDTTINHIDEWGRKLGLGVTTGIDLPNEISGNRASRETHNLLSIEERDWTIADTWQAAIGQSYNNFTMLQMAVYTASLATGQRVTPYVIADVTRPDGTLVYKTEPQLFDTGMSQSTIDMIRQSMVAVTATSEGTASRAFEDFPIAVAAKTGTAETGLEDYSSSNGLFIAYAPADNPEIAIAQIIEKGRWGSNTIAVARDLMEAYFGLNQQSTGDEIDRPGWVDIVETEIEEADDDEIAADAE